MGILADYIGEFVDRVRKKHRAILLKNQRKSVGIVSTNVNYRIRKLRLTNIHVWDRKLRFLGEIPVPEYIDLQHSHRNIYIGTMRLPTETELYIRVTYGGSCNVRIETPGRSWGINGVVEHVTE